VVVQFEREVDVYGRHVALYDAIDSEVVLQISE